jgi:hypothetical protein
MRVKETRKTTINVARVEDEKKARRIKQTRETRSR